MMLTTKVKQTLTIAAPPRMVFAFLCDPESMHTLRGARWVDDEVTELPGGLHRTRSHRTVDGRTLRVESEGLERVPYSKVVLRTRREHAGLEPFDALITYSLAPVGEGTRLSRRIESRGPDIYPVGPIAHYKALRVRKRNVYGGLERLKVAIESAAGQEAPGTTYVVPRRRRRPFVSRRTRKLLVAAIAVVAIAVVVVLRSQPVNDNSPGGIASAYVNVILGTNWRAPCSFVLPTEKETCLRFFRSTQIPNVVGVALGGHAEATRSVGEGNKAVVSVTFELCPPFSECTRSPNSNATVLPSSTRSFERAYANVRTASPLASHGVACVRVKGKWYVDMTPPAPDG